jgi:hypothetical protein
MKARNVFVIAILVLAVGAAAGLAFGISSLLGRFHLFEKDVSDRFVLYIEGMSPASKLVLLQGVERFTASKEFTATILAVLNLNAGIEISALADTAYYVDLADASKWKARWSPRAGRLRITAPAPEALPPAVRTDTIEVRTTGANLLSSTVFQLRKETEAMRANLSSDLLEQSRKALRAPELRSRLSESLGKSARSFCEAVLGISPRTVEVSFSD